MLLSSCKSGGGDEPQVDYGPATVEVTLHFPSTELTPYREIEYDARAIESDTVGVRYIVRAYAVDGNGDCATVPAAQLVTTGPVAASLDTRCRFKLPSGRYKLLAWADYTRRGSTADRYYDCSDFSDVELTPLALSTGSDDTKLCYCGTGSIEFHVPATDSTRVVASTVNLTPPVGKFKYVATDYNKFVDKDKSGYRVVFLYNGFLPSNFNLFRNLPFNSVTGKHFVSTLSEMSTQGTGSATLGYDYVMVNGDEGSVNVLVGLYNEEGKLTGRTTALEVPLKRGGLTVVRGSFLTHTANTGGIGIDPGFDGDIDVYY